MDRHPRLILVTDENAELFLARDRRRNRYFKAIELEALSDFLFDRIVDRFEHLDETLQRRASLGVQPRLPGFRRRVPKNPIAARLSSVLRRLLWMLES